MNVAQTDMFGTVPPRADRSKAFPPPLLPGEFALRDQLVELVQIRPGDFHTGFADWLKDNFPIWREFQKRTIQIHRSGRKHFGHRLIWEGIRYETALAKKTGDYQLNNNFTKSVATLTVMLHPTLAGFFDFRERDAHH